MRRFLFFRSDFEVQTVLFADSFIDRKLREFLALTHSMTRKKVDFFFISDNYQSRKNCLISIKQLDQCISIFDLNVQFHTSTNSRAVV